MKFRIDNQKLTVTKASRVEYFQLKNHLTRHVKNHKFNKRVKMGVWDGQISYFNNGSINIGLWKECMALCQKNDWAFEIENKEEFPLNRDVTYEKFEAFCLDFFKDHKQKDKVTPFYPYPHQMQSAFRILRNRYCITEVATGGGKSFIFALVVFYVLSQVKPDARFLLMVPNISLVCQFTDDLKEYNEGLFGENKNPLPINIEEIMSDKPRRCRDQPNVFIGTSASLEKYPKEWFKQFYGVVSDEAHKAGQGSEDNIKQVAKVLGNTVGHAYLRFGMSGTFPAETTLDYLTIQNLMGPKIAEVRADTLMQKGVIAPVKIKSLILNHNDLKFNNDVTFLRRSGQGKTAFDLEKKFVQHSERRMDFIFDKILTKITQNTLVLFHIKEYGERVYQRALDTLEHVETYHIDGDTKTETREDIKKRMEDTTGKPKLLVASFGTLSTGVSVKSLCNVVFLESFKSEQIVIQSIGRILRLHAEKGTAIAFDIVDIFAPTKSNALYAHYLERKSFYDNRNYPNTEMNINM